MQLIQPIEPPEENLCDPVSGYSISIPVTLQGYPNWWRAEPDTYQRILDMRVRYNIAVDDGIEEWEAETEDARDDA